MPTPNQVYVSNSIPFGGLFINIYRFPNNDMSAVPVLIGSGSTMESFNPTKASIDINRPAIDGGDNGWALVNGIIEGAATIQIPTSASTTPDNGDIFLCSAIFKDSSGTAIPQYLVLKGCAITVSTTEYWKITCTAKCDQFATVVTIPNIASIVEATN